MEALHVVELTVCIVLALMCFGDALKGIGHDIWNALRSNNRHTRINF